MASKKYYDDDDLYDEEDDDDWYGSEEDEYDHPAQAPKAPAKGAPSKAAPATKAKPAPAAAGVSSLARALCGPPPALPTGQQQRGAKKLPQAEAIKKQPHPIVPPAATAAAAAAGVQRFQFDKPSPDDAVLRAQQGRNGGAGAAPSSSSGGGGGLASGVQSLSLNSQPPAPAAAAAAAAAAPEPPEPFAAPQHAQQAGRTLRPMSEYKMESSLAEECEKAASRDTQSGKPKLHLVVLGHVDAGKSTLMGRMLFELGLVSDKAVHKTQRDAAAAGKGSFAWAWMLDERPEERARGVTVDVAMTRFETPGRNVTLLDAPGHRDFVPNMISGAAQADAAVLVVDGSQGGFEAGFEAAAAGHAEGGGQTREHAQLARSLGVEQVAVVVTKLDTCEYDQQRFEYVKSQLEPFLRHCGFQKASTQWLPAVALTGENLAKPPADPRLAAWWKGPTLAQAIDNFRPAHRLLEKPLRLPVSDVQKSGKAGVSVGGKLEGGALRPGSKVLIMPARLEATVKSIEVDGHSTTLARAGDGADITLTGVDAGAVAAGSVLCHPDFPVPLVSKFEARVVVLDVPLPLLRGQQVTLHAHTARESGHVSGLLSLLDSKSGEVVRAKPRCILKGQTAVIEVTPARPICLEDYRDLRALGRVALRDGGRTVAVGIVTAITTVN